MTLFEKLIYSKTKELEEAQKELDIIEEEIKNLNSKNKNKSDIIFKATFNVLERKRNAALSSRNDQKKQLENIKKGIASFEKKSEYSCMTNIYKEIPKDFNIYKDALKKLCEEQMEAIPFLADIISEYYYEIDYLLFYRLKYKNNPALKAAYAVSEISKENKELRKEMLIYKYQLSVYENLFPQLEEYKEFTKQDIEHITKLENMSDNQEIDEYSTLNKWISRDEYNTLSHIEKYQLALDRYITSNKTKWQIGIEYERYVGYTFEKQGYKVKYSGALEGFLDRGRDLIAELNGITYIIQCKNWSKDKIIHEKHIFQLYGSVLSYTLNDGKIGQIKLEDSAKGIFITTTKLSDFARNAANALNIEIRENFEFDNNFPRIKCNIGKDEFGYETKIYHLPMDQQYDSVMIDKQGEFLAFTVAEAEQAGFRRAYKWYG